MRRHYARAAAAFGAAVLVFATACSNDERPRAGSTASPTSSAPTSASPSPSPTRGGATPATTPRGSTNREEWRRIASAPTRRQEVAATVLGGKIYVAGGLLSNSHATNIVEIYDPATNRWTAGPRLPVSIHHPMAATLGNTIVVMGGYADVLGGAASDRVFLLRSGRWREGPRLKHARGAAAAVAFKDSRIVLVGGLGNNGHVAPIEIFNGTTWRDGAPIPTLRDHLAAAADGTSVYAAGGRREGRHFNTFEAYDVAANKWRKLRNVPTARSGFGAAALGSLIVTVGGEGPRIFPEVEAYHPSGAWSRLDDLGVPRHGLGVVAIGSTIYALVGGDEVGLGPTAACEALTLD